MPFYTSTEQHTQVAGEHDPTLDPSLDPSHENGTLQTLPIALKAATQPDKAYEKTMTPLKGRRENVSMVEELGYVKSAHCFRWHEPGLRNAERTMA